MANKTWNFLFNLRSRDNGIVRVSLITRPLILQNKFAYELTCYANLLTVDLILVVRFHDQVSISYSKLKNIMNCKCDMISAIATMWSNFNYILGFSPVPQNIQLQSNYNSNANTGNAAATNKKSMTF